MFFFFKQKTAYEMRISDWSSDVCSSDLGDGGAAFGAKLGADRLRVVRREAGEHALDGGEDGGGIRIGRRQGGALDDGRDRGDLEEKREEGEHGWNPMQSSPSLSRGGGPCEAWWRGKGDVARRCA